MAALAGRAENAKPTRTLSKTAIRNCMGVSLRRSCKQMDPVPSREVTLRSAAGETRAATFADGLRARQVDQEGKVLSSSAQHRRRLQPEGGRGAFALRCGPVPAGPR
jgi:hypothetical protein